MRGTRYGDFSRLPDEPHRHYRAAPTQQGRTQLDSDTNVQAQLAQATLETALGDLMGRGWGPGSGAGFRIGLVHAMVFDGGEPEVVAEDAGAAEILGQHGEERTIELWLTWDGGAGVILDAVDKEGVPCLRLDVGESGILTLEHAGGVALVASGPLPLGQRAHVTIMFGHGTAALFLGGAQLARGPLPANSGRVATKLALGGPLGDRRGRGLTGSISAMRVWNVERSARQLAEASQADGPQDEVAADGSPLFTWRFGGAGADPELAAGKPDQRLSDLTIGRGRYYVGGVCCELEHDQLYREQPGAHVGALPPFSNFVIYLETWEETVTAVEDHNLLEVALGGLDTTVRTRVAHRVAVAHQLPQLHTQGLLAARHEGELVPGNHLYRVEVHASGHAWGDEPSPEVTILEVDLLEWELVLAEPWGVTEVDVFEILVVLSSGRVERHTVAGRRVDAQGRHRLRLATDPSTIATDPARRARHARATFKWSRDNGATLFAIERHEHEPARARVRPARWLKPLAAGDVVEPLSEHSAIAGPAPELLRVVRVERAAAGEVEVELSGHLPHGTSLLRRWDHRLGDLGGALELGPHWAEIEDGIAVKVERGHYRRGDYWWIVARQEIPGIQWPHDAGGPRPMPPDGVDRVVAPLARVTWTGKGVPDIEDLRTLGLGSEGPRGPDAVPEDRPEPKPWPKPPEPFRPEPRREPWPAPDPPAMPAVVEAVELAEWELIAEPDLGGGRPHAIVEVGERLLVGTHEHLFSVFPESGAVELLGPLPVPREGYSLHLVGEVVILAGGGPDGRVFAFELEAGTWSERARLPHRREGVVFAVLEGILHAIGGHRPRGRHRPHRSHHVHDGDRWRRHHAKPHHPRAHGAAAALHGHLHLIGGVDRHHVPHPHHEALREGRWHHEAGLPAARHVRGAVAHGDHVAVLLHHERGPTLLGYQPLSGVWHPFAPFHQPLRHPVLGTHRGHVLVAGEGPRGVAMHRTRLREP